MNHIELSALRRHLFFTQAEAAKLIGGVNERTWQRWEKGEFEIPEHVAKQLHKLFLWRQNIIDYTLDLIEEKENEIDLDEITLDWYETLDEFKRKPDYEEIYWRPHQSACAELCGYDVILVNSKLERQRLDQKIT